MLKASLVPPHGGWSAGSARACDTRADDRTHGAGCSPASLCRRVTNDAARNQKTVNFRGGLWPRVFEEPEPAEECGGSML